MCTMTEVGAFPWTLCITIQTPTRWKKKKAPLESVRVCSLIIIVTVLSLFSSCSIDCKGLWQTQNVTCHNKINNLGQTVDSAQCCSTRNTAAAVNVGWRVQPQNKLQKHTITGQRQSSRFIQRYKSKSQWYFLFYHFLYIAPLLW